MSTYTPSAEALAAARRMQQAVSDAGATMTLSSGDRSVTIGAVTPDAVSGHITERPHDRAFIPPDEYFNDGDDFLESIELERVGAALVARYPEFAFLEHATILYRWKRKGGQTKKKNLLGNLQKPTGLLKHFAESDYILWLAADHCRELMLTNLQLEALLYHELCHCWWEEDEDEKSPTYGEMKLSIRNHDDELFRQEIGRYAPWNDNRKQTLDAFRQIALPAGGAS